MNKFKHLFTFLIAVIFCLSLPAQSSQYFMQVTSLQKSGKSKLESFSFKSKTEAFAKIASLQNEGARTASNQRDGHCDITSKGFAIFGCGGTGEPSLYAFSISGENLPMNGNQKFVVDGQVMPTPDILDITPNAALIGWEGSNTPYPGQVEAEVFVQLDDGCTLTFNEIIFSVAPPCGGPPCDITNMTLRSSNPTPCNGDGSHDLKLKLFGPGLPASAGDAKVVVDGTEYPIVSWNKLANGTVNLRANNIMASGNMPNVFVQAESGCTYFIQDMYTKPSCNTRLAGDLGSAFVYPNPTIGTFTISGKNFSKASYRIVNTMGQIVVKGTISNYNDELVDLSRFDKGLYIVTVTEGEQVMTERIVKR